MATDSSILAWKILWTEEPGGLQSMDRKELDTTESYLALMLAWTLKNVFSIQQSKLFSQSFHLISKSLNINNYKL